MSLLMVAVAALSALYRVAPQFDVFVLGAAPTAFYVYHGMQCWRRQHRLSRPLIAAVLPSFGMLYVAAVGPAIVLANHDPFWENIFDHVYAPLAWLYEHTMLYYPLDWYARFWHDLR